MILSHPGGHGKRENLILGTASPFGALSYPWKVDVTWIRKRETRRVDFMLGLYSTAYTAAMRCKSSLARGNRNMIQSLLASWPTPSPFIIKGIEQTAISITIHASLVSG